jgi:hypothetical protein
MRVARSFSSAVKPDFTVMRKSEWLDGDGFAHPTFRNILELEKNNKVNWTPFIQGIDACWLYRPETSGSGEGR